MIVTEEDVQQATQERGAADTLPPIRQRPGIRRALNAALIRFPAFRLSKSNRPGTQNGGRSRSKSVSSTSHSVLDGTSESAPSEKPSRHPSDATSRRKPSGEFGADIRRIISGGRDQSPHRTPSTRASGASTPATGGSRSGWGSRIVPSRDRSDGHSTGLGAFPPLARSVSASSVTAANSGRSRYFLSSSQPPARPTSSARTASGDSSASRPGSPGQWPASDTEPSGRRRLTNVLSRLGGRKTPRPPPERQSSLSDDDSLSIVGISTSDGVRAVTRSALDIFARGSEFETVTDFEVDSDYSSEDDDDDDDDVYGDELAGPPLSTLDGLSGWHNGHAFATFAVGSFADPDAAEKKAPSTYTLREDSTPRASAHLTTLSGLDPEPSITPPPLVRQASDTHPPKRPQAVRGRGRGRGRGRLPRVPRRAAQEARPDDRQSVTTRLCLTLNVHIKARPGNLCAHTPPRTNVLSQAHTSVPRR